MLVTPIQIRFNDMDAMGRVNNASYAAYLELGRMAFTHKHFTIRRLEDTPFVLVRVEMDILNSLRINDRAEIHTWVAKIGHTSWQFSQKILNPDSRVVFVQARTTQIYFDYHNNCKRTIPDSFRQILQNEME